MSVRSQGGTTAASGPPPNPPLATLSRVPSLFSGGGSVGLGDRGRRGRVTPRPAWMVDRGRSRAVLLPVLPAGLGGTASRTAAAATQSSSLGRLEPRLEGPSLPRLLRLYWSPVVGGAGGGGAGAGGGVGRRGCGWRRVGSGGDVGGGAPTQKQAPHHTKTLARASAPALAM